jgi:hypothetical protein
VSRRLAWLGLIALLALGTAWFFATFDRIPVTEHVPPTGEARLRDFLAAERFAERMGVRSRELRSLPDLDRLAPGVLLVPNRRPSRRARAGCSPGRRRATIWSWKRSSSAWTTRCSTPSRSSGAATAGRR